MEGTGSSQCVMGGTEKVASENPLHWWVRDAFMGKGQCRETQQMYQCGEWLATAHSSMKSILMRNLENGAMSRTYPWSVLMGPLKDPERTGSGWDHCHRHVEAGCVSMPLPVPSHLHRAGLCWSNLHIGADITVYLKKNKKWRLKMIMMKTTQHQHQLEDWETWRPGPGLFWWFG